MAQKQRFDQVWQSGLGMLVSQTSSHALQSTDLVKNYEDSFDDIKTNIQLELLEGLFSWQCPSSQVAPPQNMQGWAAHPSWG